MKALTVSLAEQDKKKDGRRKVKVSFGTVRLIKDYQAEILSAEQAADAAGIPISTFYRYAKMEQEKLYKMARQAQYEAMSPKEKATYNASMAAHREFAAAMANVRACHNQVLERQEAKEQKARETYAKNMNKRSPGIRIPKKESIDKPNLIDIVLNGRERTCEMCSKIFYINGKDSYQYQRNIKGKPKYCCSWNCYSKMLIYYGIKGRERAKK